MKHPIMKWLGMAAWLISALITINAGLSAFGYNFFNTQFAMTNLAGLMMPISYIILAAGLYCLFGFVMAVSGNCGCGGKGSCCK